MKRLFLFSAGAGAEARRAHGERHQPAHALTTTVTSPVCRSFIATSLCGFRLLRTDGQNERVRIVKRDTMTELASFGRGGRQPGQFYGVHSIAVDSKGNIYTTETYEGKRIQKFVFKGIGSVPAGEQGSLWPRRGS